MNKTTILTLDEADAWREALARHGTGDVYYDPGYLRPLALRGEGEPLLFSYEDGPASGVHVVQVRSLNDLPFAHPYDDCCDAVTPYGYAGPHINAPAYAKAMWDAWCAMARERKIIAEFIRFHPLLRNHVPLAARLQARTVSQTIWIDLTGDVEQSLSKSRRRDARYAARQGVVVERCGPDRLPAFAAMYRATMRRREAEDYYFFDDKTFARLAEELGDGFWLLRAHRDGVDCSYALCLRHGPFLHYHLSCSADEMSHLRSVNLALLTAAKMGAAAGCKHFHLGGGYRGEDSLFAFKAHFSPLRADFVIGHYAHDPAIVAELAVLARAADAAPPEHFFPPYRSTR